MQRPVFRQKITGVSISEESTHELLRDVMTRDELYIGAHFVDADGVQVTPSAGTVTFTIETMNSPGNFESILNGTAMDCTAALRTLDVGGNHTRIKVTPSSISGNNVDSMVLILTANEG